MMLTIAVVRVTAHSLCDTCSPFYTVERTEAGKVQSLAQSTQPKWWIVCHSVTTTTMGDLGLAFLVGPPYPSQFWMKCQPLPRKLGQFLTAVSTLKAVILLGLQGTTCNLQSTTEQAEG